MEDKLFFIIYPRDHQFAVQHISGLIIKYFDNCTLEDVRVWLDLFRSKKQVAQLELF